MKLKKFNEMNSEPEFKRVTVPKKKYKSMAPSNIVYMVNFDNYIQTIVGMTTQWEQLFGKSDFTWIGEYKTKTYSFEYNGDYYFVISGPGRGTSLESTIDLGDYLTTGKVSDSIKKDIQAFVDFLYNNLITLDDDKVNFWKNK